jgi:hypothetical protein
MSASRRGPTRCIGVTKFVVMTLEHRRFRLASLALACTCVVASCSSDTDSDAVSSTDITVSTEVPASTETTVSTDVPVDSEAPAVTDVPPATDAAATTAAPDTTAPPAPADPPVLVAAGIGPHSFGGATPDDLIAYLTPFVGSPTSVVSVDYPIDADGYFESAAEELGFTYPSGRTVCFSNNLCAEFGAADAASLNFVGFRQNEGSGSLTTASGVTAGSAGSDFVSAIEVEAGGCFSTGTGSADGVQLLLQSSGDMFGYYDDTTEEYVSQIPPLEDIVVLSVFGGDEPFNLDGDC